jgi:hypothetical protein
VESRSLAPPKAPAEVEHINAQLQNGDFEQGSTTWSEASSNGWPLIVNRDYLAAQGVTGLAPYDGNWLAWLGGGDDEISNIQQTFSVPNGSPFLRMWLYLGSSEELCSTPDYVFDALYIVFDTQVYWSPLCLERNTAGWAWAEFPLADFAGGDVNLQIQVETDSSYSSSVFVDHVEVTYPAQTNRFFLPSVQKDFFLDAFEPNNTFSAAWGPLVSGRTYKSYFPSESDNNDYFFFNVPSASSPDLGRRVEINLTNLPPGNDYDLYLYRENTTLVKHAGTVGRVNERIVVDNLAEGKYYVRVTREIGTSRTHPYSLRVQY